jgi:hypothetical protein
LRNVLIPRPEGEIKRARVGGRRVHSHGEGGGGQKRLTFPGVKVASDVELGGLSFFGLVTKIAGTFMWTPYKYSVWYSKKAINNIICLKNLIKC